MCNKYCQISFKLFLYQQPLPSDVRATLWHSVPTDPMMQDISFSVNSLVYFLENTNFLPFKETVFSHAKRKKNPPQSYNPHAELLWATQSITLI